ncbi:hypothetical protein [Alkalihalobacillus sp. AL-G]|uniref:hypothetical protein n=1 Tax=Alkalihalobacillus sp. AL-G TaxID=2926399 RepID=UPI00272A830B|nr:hypothetical protein [Alkalihalobacillus sp. AL-G]WLD91635.1 hypothetical protein MOJ78_11320 [Alkalihalobacillus sp. AL-G]
MYPNNFFNGYAQGGEEFSETQHYDIYDQQGFNHPIFHQHGESITQQEFDPDRQPQIRQLERRVNQLERQVNQLRRDVNRLDQTVSRHTGRLNRLNQRLRIVENRLAIPFSPQFDGF